MNRKQPQKIISLTQIANRNEVRYRIRFKSEDEFSNPEIWNNIVTRRQAYAHFTATVIDQTPEVKIDGLKKYFLVYGLKYLFAAEMLNLETIPVRVLDQTRDIDSSVITSFYQADYLSLSGYEKGEFLENLKARTGLSIGEIAQKAGFTYSSLQSIYGAYCESRKYRPLEDAFKAGKITSSLVQSCSFFYKSTGPSIHKDLTGFIVEKRKNAYDLLRRGINSRDEGVTVRKAIRNVICAPAEPAAKKENKYEDISEAFEADGAVLSAEEKEYIGKRMQSDRKFGILVRSYQTLRKNCREAYTGLTGILPGNLVLDYETALTLPKSTQFSYAVPKEFRPYCRDIVPMDKNERRLFVRMMEYIAAAGNGMKAADIVEITSGLFEDSCIQKKFSQFFKYSIFYRNIREKVIAELKE